PRRSPRRRWREPGAGPARGWGRSCPCAPSAIPLQRDARASVAHRWQLVPAAQAVRRRVVEEPYPTRTSPGCGAECLALPAGIEENLAPLTLLMYSSMLAASCARLGAPGPEIFREAAPPDESCRTRRRPGIRSV